MSSATSGARLGGRTRGAPVLVIDTATSTALVGLGELGGMYRDERTWRAGYRHGQELLARIEGILAAHHLAPGGLGGVIVGTGPGSFTGSRVGLATAKGLAHGLGIGLAAVSTAAALRAAAVATGALAAGSSAQVAILLPAGPSDRVLVLDGSIVHLPGDAGPDLPAGTVLLAVDLEGRAPDGALSLGHRAFQGLGPALLALGSARLAAGEDDLADAVPAYATLPRGVREESGEVAWSRDPR